MVCEEIHLLGPHIVSEESDPKGALIYSGGKKNPDLQIKTTENVHVTR